jgi:aminoglycoside 6'-N-acetyltransferase
VNAGRYRFRPVTLADTGLLARWHATPDVARWWEDWEEDEVAELLDDPAIAAWIVELAPPDPAPPRQPAAPGEFPAQPEAPGPFAYMQDYDPHAWPGHHFGHLPPGTRGIDQFIGEPDLLNQGHGTALIHAHTQRLLANGAPAIATDPHPDNARAIRAYEKAGFRAVGEPVETEWGLVLRMVLWR